MIVGTLAIGGHSCFAESWTDLRGRRTIQAEMLGLWGDTVVLRRADGKRIGVKLLGLRSESRIQAQQLAKKLTQQQKETTERLLKEKAIATAPAPDPLPIPPPAPAYQAPQAGASADVFLGQIEQAMRNGHLLAAYESMPPSYRQDVDEIVKMAAAKLSPDNFHTLTDVLHRLGDVVITKQNWIFSSPRLSRLDENGVETARQLMLPLADFLRTGFASEAINLEDLRTQPFGQWLKKWDAKAAPHLAQLVKLSNSAPVLDNLTVEDAPAGGTAKQSGEEAQEEMVILKSAVFPGGSQTYKKVEGYWVAKSQADNWAEMMGRAKASIEKLEEGTALSGVTDVMRAISQAMSPLEIAATDQEFHQSFEAFIAQGTQAALRLLSSAGRGISFGNGIFGGGFGNSGNFNDAGF